MNKTVSETDEVLALKTCLRLLDEITTAWDEVFEALELDRTLRKCC